MPHPASFTPLTLLEKEKIMTYTEEKKQEILHLLATEAGNNIARCAQLTGISKNTLLKWKKTHLSSQQPASTSPAIAKLPQNTTASTASAPSETSQTSDTSSNMPTFPIASVTHPVPTSRHSPTSSISASTNLPTPSISTTPEIPSGNLPPIHTPRTLPTHPLIPETQPSQPAIPASELPEPETPREVPLPTPAELKRRIIRRVSQLIDTCTDLKKLMDTHEALSKTERDSAPPTQESLFDLLSRRLSSK